MLTRILFPAVKFGLLRCEIYITIVAAAVELAACFALLANPHISNFRFAFWATFDLPTIVLFVRLTVVAIVDTGTSLTRMLFPAVKFGLLRCETYITIVARCRRQSRRCRPKNDPQCAHSSGTAWNCGAWATVLKLTGLANRNEARFEVCSSQCVRWTYVSTTQQDRRRTFIVFVWIPVNCSTK